MSTIIVEVLTALSPLLLAGIGYLAKIGADLIKAHVANQYLQGALIRLDSVVEAAIKEIAQTSIDALKKGGGLTPDVAVAARNAAIAKAKEHLGPKGLAELAHVFGVQGAGLDSFLGTRVEAAVLDLKRSESRRIQQTTPTP